MMVGMGSDAHPRQIEAVVVGAGQAGLVMSTFLQAAGREHVLLDRREALGGGWQDRWDEFCLVTPNWVTSLPAFAYDGPDPDGFMPRDLVIERLRGYAEAISAPVELETEVRRLTPRDGGGFRLATNRGPVEAREVVVAAGGFHAPRIPPIAASLPERIVQVHSHRYRYEAALPPGAVLVVGSGQSGVQLAEELKEAGRRLILSVGRCGRVPRRYRGRDIFGWFVELASRGKLPTVDTLPDPRLRFAGNPHLSGHGGGHDTNLRRFAKEGIRLVGHLDGVDGERILLAPGLASNLRFADTFFDERMRTEIDTVIEQAGIDAPPDDRETVDYEPPEVLELDLAVEGVSTVLWTSGYRLDFSWIDLPIFDEFGAPRHVRGVTEVPGLTFLGLPWQLNQGSATFFGVANDARYLAERW
jgi:putative flavoprotein involved in K+ transport